MDTPRKRSDGEADTNWPFGEFAAYQSGISPLHFTGKYHDGESGLDFFGARYYSSAQGRFLTADPLPWIAWQSGNRDDQRRFAAFISDPQDLNQYAYVLGNPLSRTDPSGMYVCSGSASDCAKINAAYTLLAQAAKNAKPGTQAAKDINRALNALGKPGQKNGVTVRIATGSAWRMDTQTRSGQTTITVELSGVESTLRSDKATNLTAEEASLLGHESSHAADQIAMGMPNSSQQELGTERRAYATQGEIDRSLGYQSVFGLWTPSGALSQKAIDFYANRLLQLWCSERVNCQ